MVPTGSLLEILFGSGYHLCFKNKCILAMLVLSWSVALQMGPAEAVPGLLRHQMLLEGQLVDGCGAFV
jgi:hypothetical protein